MKKRDLTLLTAFAAAAALAPTAQAAPITAPTDGYEGPYRLAFVTNGEYGAKSQVIADYNTFVSDEAALVSELAALGATWNCIGSTGTVSAKVNTGTDSTGDANDVPIYTTTGLRVADDNADLWDGSIATPVYFGDGTVAGVEGGAQEQTWTGTESDGSSRPVGGDGSYLGAGDGGDGTAAYITLARGGYTDGNWIEGPSSHDGTPDNNRTYTKHFMAMSDVIGGVPAPSISITSITSLGGGNWELTLEGEASTGYEFYSSPILDFTPGDLVINLTQGDPGDPGDISGDNSEVLTTDGNGDGTARMTLSGSPADFVRVQTAPPPPPLFSEDFEGGDGGFTVAQQATGDLWVYGDPPDSDNGVTDPVDGGNGGSMGCWGTDITNPGFYGPDTSTCLRSVDIDLSDAASAFLTFAEVLDLQSPHTAVVNIIEAVGVGDAVLATAIHNSDPDPDINDTQWAPANGGADIEIPPGVLGQTVRIEWRLDGDGTEVDGYLGWYIDDVVVKKVPNTP